MRPKRLNYDQLVDQNIQDILKDENRIDQLEMRLEKRHEASALKHREQTDNKV
ncbi:FbpB family small basic protein [Oceanobacillus sp. CAU 1775]